MVRVDDPWLSRQAQLEVQGWVFYDVARYDPTIARAYSTPFLTGSAAVRRKANRPVYVWLRRTTALTTDPWNGTMNMGQASTLNPWSATATSPYGDTESDWAVGPTGHYNPDLVTTNPVVFQELDTVTPDSWLATMGLVRQQPFAPAATITKSYGDCSDPDTALAAIRDLFNSITV